MRQKQHGPWRLRTLVLALALAGAWSPAGAQAPAASGAASRDRVFPLEVAVNATPGGSWAFLEHEGVLFAPVQAFDEWRIRRPLEAHAQMFRGQQWYPLALVPGYQAKLNSATQSIDLSFSPDAFLGNRLEGPAETTAGKAVEPIPSLFLTFDTTLDVRRLQGASTSQSMGALFELGYSSAAGVFSSSFVGRDLTSSDADQRRELRRLETSYTRHFVEQGLTLRVGDSLTRPNLLGRQFYFGGLQLSRNFGLTPSFVTQPIPVITGTSAAPSTVELYVNDVLRQTSRVPTGPFVVDNLPATPSPGEARLVVRDVLGRETVIYQPFFTDARLLETGLTDWSVEAGAPREGLGVVDNEYGHGFASGLLRSGITKSLTLEARGEWSQPARNIGLAALFGLPLQTLGLLGAAASHDVERGSGQRWLLGAEHRKRAYAFNLRAEASSTNYVDLASRSPTFRPNRLEVSTSLSYNAGGFGTTSLALTRITTAGNTRLTTATINHALPVGARGILNFYLARISGGRGGTAAGLTLTLPLEQGLSYSAVAARHSGDVDTYASATKSITNESGTGWRVLGGARAGDAVAEGGIYHQTHHVSLTGDIATSRRQQTVRLGSQGSLVLIDGSVFANRRLSSSYALVEVPGYAGVGVGLHGVPSARTDASGRALVSGLLPYQSNSIRLNPAELPLSAELDNIEQIVVPPEKAGVRVLFPVRSGRAALLRIRLQDGDVAPAGAEVRVADGREIFYVARRGQAFVTGLQPRNQLTLAWKGRTCRLEVDVPAGNVDDIARIGPLTCTGVPR